MKKKPITLLKNKTVAFADENGILHYGTVKRECRISYGPKRDKKADRTVKRFSIQGFVILQTFKRLGLKYKKEHRVPINNVLAVRVQRKEIPIGDFLNDSKK